MLNNSTPFKVQTASYERYVQDMWIVAFLFVFILNETTISLPIIWICTHFFIVLVANYSFSKFGPNLFSAIIIPVISLLFLLIFGAPLWLYGIGVLISVWSLSSRYNVIQFDEDYDNPYPLLSFIVFLCVHLLCVLLSIDDYKLPLYSLFIGGIIFFVGNRFFSIWRKSRTHTKESFSHVMIFYLLGLSGIVFLTFIVFYIFDPSRNLLSVILGWMLTLIMIPLTPLFNLLEKYVSGLLSESIEEEPLNIETNGDNLNDMLPQKTEALDYSFPFEWILLGVLGIVVLLLIIYMIRKKIESPMQDQERNFIYENGDIVIHKEEPTTPSLLYSVETSFLRELYLEFENEANSLGYDREKSETVREWFQRMSWNVENKFFSIYEEVRYGGRMVEKEKAEIFIKELEKIKKIIFFEKEV